MHARVQKAATTNVTLARYLEKFMQFPKLTANTQYQVGQEKDLCIYIWSFQTLLSEELRIDRVRASYQESEWKSKKWAHYRVIKDHRLNVSSPSVAPQHHVALPKRTGRDIRARKHFFPNKFAFGILCFKSRWNIGEKESRFFWNA